MFLVQGDHWGVKLEQLMNWRDVERQHYTYSHLSKTSMNRKSVPWSHVATRQQNLDAKAEIPFKQRPPPLQSCRTHVWIARRQPQLLRQYQLQAALWRTALRTLSSHREITDQSLRASAKVSEEKWALYPIDDNVNDFYKVPFPVPVSPHLFTTFYSCEISFPLC